VGVVGTLGRRSWVEQIMGMPISVLGRGAAAHERAAADAVAAVFAQLRAVDARFSTYRPDSEVSGLNAGTCTWAQASAEVRHVAELCEQARTRTAGLFDAARPDGSWDPSGLVKGWATEGAARLLADVELDWCLNAGGDVVVLAPSGADFGVGIADPGDATAVVAVIRRTAGGVATSGSAARGAHLYDPRTGRPVAGALASVTVAGPSLQLADVLATAAFVAGADWAGLLADEPDYSGLAVTRDGALQPTPDWPGTASVRPAAPRHTGSLAHSGPEANPKEI
jgi:thiamine biosynthesis lipoprotein